MGALRLWIRGGMLLGAGLLLAGIAVTAAQNDLGTCPEIVTQALQSVEDLCAGQPRNSACYGNTLVNAQFVDETPPGFFANEGDVVNLGLVRALETSPLGDPEDSWGVSLLSVQASLPGALPGQNALYLLLGGAQIENAVTPSTAFQSARPFPVTALTPALLLTEPRSDADPIAQVAAGETLLADAQSGDSAYVRVTVSETFGWVERSALLADSALEALPSYTPGDSFGPMQAFYLRSGIGGPQCAVAPSALVVQGPESFTVAINANGADISFGSTLILRALSLDEAKARGLARQAGQGVGGLLEVSVLDGEAVVEDEAGNPTVIKAGERSVICLSEPDDLGVDGLPNDQAITDACGGWTDPEPIPPDFRNQFALLDAFALNYPLGVFAPTPTPSITPPLPTFSPVPSQTRWPTAIPATATPIPPTTIPPTAVPPTAIPPTQPPPSVAPSLTPSVTGTLTDTPTPTATETATDTPAPTATDTVTDTPVPTDTPSETPTGIPSNTPTATLTPTRTPSGAGADIEVEDVDRSASSILEGEEVCFSVRLRNNGPDDAYDATLSDMLPVGLTYTSSLVSQGFYDSLTDIWTMGTVLDGEEPEITVCGTADAGTAGTTLSTTAVLYASNDSSGGGNTAFLSVDVVTP